MKNFNSRRFNSILVFTFLSMVASAQSWEFSKEKDGIKIFIRKEPGKTLKSFKGVAEIHAPAGRIYSLIEDAYHTEWWDKGITEVKVMLYEKDRRAQFYMVYDLPWPVTDRDLCVDATVSIDGNTGISRIISVSSPALAPERKDLVRIRDYRQTWTITPEGKELTHVELEGYADPAGSIPDWLTNMLLTDSPLKTIGEVKRRMEGK